MVICCAEKDTLDHKQKISGHLCKAHWHPGPPELASVGTEGQVIRRGALALDIVEASLQVQYGDSLSLLELRLVLPHVIELKLALIHLFIDQDYILAHPVRLPRLSAWY